MPSDVTIQKKQQKIKELADIIKDAKAMVLADYRGLKVSEDTKFRTALRNADIEYRVVKNSITRFAFKENGLEELEPYLVGPTAIAISNTDPVAPARLLAKYAKEYPKLELKAGIVEGKIIDIDGLKMLAQLPSRDELIAKVLGGLNAPIYGFASVLNANIRGLVVALNAIKEQKESA